MAASLGSERFHKAMTIRSCWSIARSCAARFLPYGTCFAPLRCLTSTWTDSCFYRDFPADVHVHQVVPHERCIQAAERMSATQTCYTVRACRGLSNPQHSPLSNMSLDTLFRTHGVAWGRLL